MLVKTTPSVAAPYWPLAGVNVNVPLGLMLGAALNSAGLLSLWTAKPNEPLVPGAPALMFVAQLAKLCAAAFSTTASFGPTLNEGGLVWTMVMVVCWGAEVKAPLAAVTSSVAVPDALALSWNVSVPLASMAGALLKSEAKLPAPSVTENVTLLAPPLPSVILLAKGSNLSGARFCRCFNAVSSSSPAYVGYRTILLFLKQASSLRMWVTTSTDQERTSEWAIIRRRIAWKQQQRRRITWKQQQRRRIADSNDRSTKHWFGCAHGSWILLERLRVTG